MQKFTHYAYKLKLIWPFLPLTLLAMYVASYAIWTTPAGTIVTALPTGWGDMIVHLRAAVFYDQQGGVPHQSFLLSNQPVGYAWPADYLSSLLLKINVPLSLSFSLPTILFTGFFVFGLQWLAYHLTRSRLAAIITALLFLGFSGLGGFYTLPELINSPNSWTATLRTLPHHVTAWHTADMVILNPFVMMLHQRGYLLGFPLLVLAIFFAWRWLTTTHRPSLYYASAITLALAVIHPFTWAAWLLMFPTWMVLQHLCKVKSYTTTDCITAGLTTAIAGGGGYLIVSLLQPSAGSSIAWLPGWLAQDQSWLFFWWKNIGLYVVLIPLAFFHLWRANRPLALGLLASLTPFIAANLFQFTPWDWDNTKLFTPTWLFVALAVASVLSTWWHQKNIPARRTVATITIIILIFSGSLEITRVLTHHSHPLTISTLADQAIGNSVRQHIPDDAIILTAPNPPNHPVFMLGGRPSLIAYEGWLWSQGWQGIYEPRIQHARAILQGTPQALQLLQQYHIDVVAIGPPEQAWQANHNFFTQNFPVLLTAGGYTLYDIR